MTDQKVLRNVTRVDGQPDSDVALPQPESETTPATVTPASPLPWSVEGQWEHDVDGNPFCFARWLADAEGAQVAQTILNPADAELIVRAVKNHDGLVDVLRWIAGRWIPGTKFSLNTLYQRVNEAIAKAEAASLAATASGGEKTDRTVTR